MSDDTKIGRIVFAPSDPNRPNQGNASGGPAPTAGLGGSSVLFRTDNTVGASEQPCANCLRLAATCDRLTRELDEARKENERLTIERNYWYGATAAAIEQKKALRPLPAAPNEAGTGEGSGK